MILTIPSMTFIERYRIIWSIFLLQLCGIEDSYNRYMKDMIHKCDDKYPFQLEPKNEAV